MIALAQHPSTALVLIPGKGGDPVTLLPTRLARQYVTGVHNSFVEAANLLDSTPRHSCYDEESENHIPPPDPHTE